MLKELAVGGNKGSRFIVKVHATRCLNLVGKRNHLEEAPLAVFEKIPLGESASLSVLSGGKRDLLAVLVR